MQRSGFATAGAARAALERAIDRAERRRLRSRTITLAELADEYLAQHDAQPETTAKLRWLLSKATAVFGARPIGELDAREIAHWRIELPAGHRFEATQALRQVLARAVAWGLLESNPAKVGVDNPVPKRREMLAFNAGQLRRVATALGPRYGAMVRFAAATGLRPGEWLALEWRDIDEDARLLHVRRAFRKVGITPLRRLYDLRHTFATAALHAGLGTFELSRYMGTSLVNIDRTYGHLAQDGHAHAVKLLDGYGREAASVDVGGRFVDVASPTLLAAPTAETG